MRCPAKSVDEPTGRARTQLSAAPKQSVGGASGFGQSADLVNHQLSVARFEHVLIWVVPSRGLYRCKEIDQRLEVFLGL
jgi:hypothetical protein